MATIAQESKWDEDIQTVLQGDINLIGEVSVNNIIVQGDSNRQQVDGVYIDIQSFSSRLETQVSNRLEENINIEIFIKNLNWNDRENILKVRRIILIISKILLSDTLLNNKYRLAFSNADINYESLENDYPNAQVRMTYNAIREIDPIIS